MSRRVEAEGPLDAKIMFVGEAPGQLEVTKGRPFVGPAGEQFNRMLRAAGIDRESVYVTNTVKVPVKGDKDRFFFDKGVPTAAYMEGIVELVEELDRVKPNIIVPLGNYALWAIAQRLHVSKYRGTLMHGALRPDIKVMPTYHPSFYIQQGGYNSNKEALGIWDFTRAKEESASSVLELPKARFITNPSYEEIDEAVERLLAGDHITSDTEWYGPEKLAYIGFTNAKDWAICIPPSSRKAYEAYKALLGSDVPKIWQNAMFDVVALARIGIETRNVKHDTMIAWHSCWTDLGEKSLEVISSVLTRWPYYKDQLAFVGQGDEKGQIYCCTDCVVTEEAMERIEAEELDYTGGRKGYEEQMKIFPVFAEAGIRGVRGDRERLMQMKHEYLQKANDIEDTLSEMVGHTINCRSPQQIAALVYDELGVNRVKRTTRQEVLMDIAAATKDATLKTILTSVVKVRYNRNIVSRYVNEDILDIDGRIRTNWNLAGTRSMRLSATQPWWNGVAMQTIPEEARVLFVADPGTVFIGHDLEQAEARVVAIKTRDFELLEDMEEGIDIHTKLASMLPFGMTYEELVALITEKGKDNVPQRYIAKKCRHALNYVMGSGTFRFTVNREYIETGIGLSEGESRKLRDAYLDLHPNLQAWWDNVKRQLYKSPAVMTNTFGVQRQFLGWVNDNMIREAVSWEPQSTVAMLTTRGIARAYPRIKALDPGALCLAHMHDGSLWQVNESVKEEATAIIAECMDEEVLIDRMPLRIPVEMKRGYSWGELEKAKAA